MAFQQGLSGLNSSSKALDVISNNVANASTVGFKAGTTLFADMYASAMSGGVAALQVGIGSRVAGVAQSFTQGNLTTTSNDLDMAINGNGFFRMQRSDGTIAYTRNGQFDVNRNGYIVNPNGDMLTGYAATTTAAGNSVFAGEPSVLRIDTSNMAPRETSQASLKLNLDSKDVNPLDQDPAGQDITAFLDAVDIPVDSYNYTTSMTVYDSLGNPSLMQIYMVREPNAAGVAPNEWRVYGRLSNDVVPDPADPSLSTGSPLEDLGTIPFTAFGVIDNPTNDPNIGKFTITRTSAQLGTGADDLEFTLDLTGTTQWNAAYAVTNPPNQDGYTTGSISRLTVSSDGVLQGVYSNGLTRDIGMLTLASFRSPNGLVSLGGNMWAESYESGEPALGAPGTGILGKVTSGQVEDSNVDLTQELVQMIVQQRNYQANAQSIRTQDQLLQTLVNLK